MEKNNELVEIKTKIIQSLNNGKYYNKRHTPINNVCKRISTVPCKKIKKALKEKNNFYKTNISWNGCFKRENEKEN